MVCVTTFQIPDYRNAVIVAKNPLAARRATSYAERLRLGIAVIHGEVKEGDEDELDGRASPPPSDMAHRMTSVGSTLPPLTAKEKPPINVVGDVGGKIAM
jgi:phosphoribosylpyrophosphate synthetase